MTGPLTPFADGFGCELAQLGYAPRSAEDCLRQVAHLSEWLERNRLGLGDFTDEVAQRWVRTRGEDGDVRRLYLQVLRIFRRYMDGLGVLPATVCTVSDPTVQLLTDYRRYLLEERGLVQRSATAYVGVARHFLAERAEPIEESLKALTGGDINRFVQCATVRGGEAARG
jgi:hypothetical protein